MTNRTTRYRRDHFGYNLYGSAEFTPGSKLTLGQLQQDEGKSRRRNHTTYGMFTYERDWSSAGRLRVFDMLRSAKDTIADDLIQWVMQPVEEGRPTGSSGQMEQIGDPLAAEDTWINTFYTDWQYQSSLNWKTLHRFKWETWQQRDADVQVTVDEARRHSVRIRSLGHRRTLRSREFRLSRPYQQNRIHPPIG